jgi:hypothetical protein
MEMPWVQRHSRCLKFVPIKQEAAHRAAVPYAAWSVELFYKREHVFSRRGGIIEHGIHELLHHEYPEAAYFPLLRGKSDVRVLPLSGS